MLYMVAMGEWGYIAPSEWLKLTCREKALFQAMLEDVGQKREKAMKK